MKLFFIALLLFFTKFSEAQNCSISGPTSVTVGQTYTYTATAPENCFSWYVKSGPVSIVGGNTGQTVNIQINGSGCFELCVRYLNASGCFECCFNYCPTVCCQPELQSTFICRNWEQYGGHGSVFLDLGDNCDPNTVASIDWVLTNAVFINNPALAGLNSGTTYGPGSGYNIASNACSNNIPITVTATIHYNNGCPDVTVSQQIPLDSGPIFPESFEIKTNLPSNELIIKNLTQTNSDKTTLIVVDLITGNEILNKQIEKLAPLATNSVALGDIKSKKIVLIILKQNDKIIYSKKVQL